MNLNRVTQVRDTQPIRRALISVADKTGLREFMQELWTLLPELEVYSTGGTFQLLQEVNKDRFSGEREAQLIPISRYTGQPEMQGGLVKTLDYRMYLGLLSEEFNADHQQDLTRTGSVPFDMTICNFYPFATAAAAPGATLEDMRTHIDIGGPTMIRASAKNFLRVTVVCDPAAYTGVLEELRRHHGMTTLAFRVAQSVAAFRYTADYEAAIAKHLSRAAQAAIEERTLQDLYHEEPQR